MPSMTLKELLKRLRQDPDAMRTWLHESASLIEAKPDVDSLLDKLSSEQLQLAELQLEKGRISREIGKRRKQGDNADDLIAAVASLAQRIKASNAELAEWAEPLLSMMTTAASAENVSVESGASTASTSATEELNALSVLPGNTSSPCPGYIGHAERRPGHQDDAELDVSKLLLDLSCSDVDWSNYVQHHPRRSCYHDPRWRDLISDCCGHETFYLAARSDSGRVCGVLPLVHLKSRLFGSFMVSVPYFNYGGVLSDSTAIDEWLMREAGELAKSRQATHVELRDTIERTAWPVRAHKVAMVRPLPRSIGQFDQSLSAKVRSQARKAERHGAVVDFGRLELLDDFYEVFSRNMRDLGTPVYSRELFRTILDRFPNEAFLAVVHLDGQAVAAGFLLSHGDSLEIPWASSLRRYSHLAVNMFLYRSVLHEAIRREHTFFDFGRSTPKEATWRFKRQWGAVEFPMHWHYWLADGEPVPGLGPDNIKFRVLIAVWKRLPLWLTNLLGPGIVRNLP